MYEIIEIYDDNNSLNIKDILRSSICNYFNEYIKLDNNKENNNV